MEIEGRERAAFFERSICVAPGLHGHVRGGIRLVETGRAMAALAKKKRHHDTCRNVDVCVLSSKGTDSAEMISLRRKGGVPDARQMREQACQPAAVARLR